MTDWILHSELSHLVLIPLHAKLLFLPIKLQHVDFLLHRDSLVGCAYSTAGRDKVYDQGKRTLWNRKANGHREQESQLSTTLDGRSTSSSSSSNSSSDSVHVAEVSFVHRLGLAFDLRTGWDLNDPAQRAKMWSHLQHERPILIVGSWSGPRGRDLRQTVNAGSQQGTENSEESRQEDPAMCRASVGEQVENQAAQSHLHLCQKP